MDAEKCQRLESSLLVIQYQITENEIFLKKIIQYNKDDCFATLQIAEYLIKNRLKKN